MADAFPEDDSQVDNLQEDGFQDVVHSYHRCRPNDGFVDTFYRLFLGKSPAVAAKFSRTDFRIQKLMLRQSLLEMLSYAGGIPGAREGIERLGKRHRELDITRAMYDLWLDALCESVRQHDPECTDELEHRWRLAMRKGIALMLVDHGNECG